MSNEIFVDGICEIDDEMIEKYFSQFASDVKHFQSHRHRPTNSCCFALILFESSTTVDRILRERPHQINDYSLFVKRLLPPSICSFIERLLPVSSLFVQNKIRTEFDEDKLRKFFSHFGRILRFDHDFIHDRLFIEFDDYDSVDQIFLNKDRLPNHIDIHKNILPRVQSTIEYHGRCRRQGQSIENEEIKKKTHRKKRYHSDDQYEDLLQKTIEDLIHCKAQLSHVENDCAILRMENQTMKNENEKLNQLIDIQKKFIHSISTEQRSIQSDYDQTTSRQYSFSTRLNQDEDNKSSQNSCSLPFNLIHSDLVVKQSKCPSSRIAYKYHYVKSDED